MSRCCCCRSIAGKGASSAGLSKTEGGCLAVAMLRTMRQGKEWRNATCGSPEVRDALVARGMCRYEELLLRNHRLTRIVLIADRALFSIAVSSARRREQLLLGLTGECKLYRNGATCTAQSNMNGNNGSAASVTSSSLPCHERRHGISQLWRTWLYAREQQQDDTEMHHRFRGWCREIHGETQPRMRPSCDIVRHASGLANCVERF